MILKAILSSIVAKLKAESPESPVKREDDSTKMVQVKELNEKNKSTLSAFMKLHAKYNEMLEMASSDFDEIVIYEKFTNDLSGIIHNMLKHLNERDKQIEILQEILKKQADASEPANLENAILSEEFKRVYEEKQKSAALFHEQMHDSINGKGLINQLDECGVMINKQLKELESKHEMQEMKPNWKPDLISFD